MDTHRKLAHVLSELGRYTGQIRRTDSCSYILCPFHSERTPSGRIIHSNTSRSPGYFKCYGCGKTASWDEVAPLIGLKPTKWVKPTEQFAFKALRKTTEAEKEPRELVISDLPNHKKWRTIPTSFLIEVGCKKCRFFYPERDIHGQVFVYMPVLVRGELRGFSRARLKKDPELPSYVNSPGNWTRDYGLFPYDYVAHLKPRYVVLVEGQRDALRLLLEGVPALAIMGTQSWSTRKSQLVEMLGVQFVVLLMDGDDAGEAAVELIEPQLRKLVNTKTFSLTGKDSPYWPFRNKKHPSKAAKAAGVELWDPQNLPKAKVRELRRTIATWCTEFGSNQE